jgi:hypothetical protein
LPDLDLLRSSLSLRDLAEEAGAVFRGSSLNPSSACPLHGGDNPSAFHLYASGQRWHCFTRCPAGHNDGDLFTFYMRWKSVDFPTALHDLSSRAHVGLGDKRLSKPAVYLLEKNISPPFREGLGVGLEVGPGVGLEWQSRAQSFIDYAHTQLLHPTTGAPARAYLYSERGLKPETWDLFHLGYNPTDLYDEPLSWGLENSPSLTPCFVRAGRGRGLGKIFIPRGIVIPGLSAGIPHYVKIRRPLPNDLLSEYLPPVIARSAATKQSPPPKFLSLRGSHPILFGTDTWKNLPILLLTEGEFDCMLAWQHVRDLCDVATLGSASNRASFPDLAALTRYPRIFAVYDSDPAGDQARQYLRTFDRVTLIPPPDHDLSDYFRGGGVLRYLLNKIIAS